MNWSAVLDDGTTYQGPYPTMPKERVAKLWVGDKAIPVPRGRRLVCRYRMKRNLGTGQEVGFHLIAFEPLEAARRMQDTWGYIVTEQHITMFQGYTDDVDLRPPMLTAEDF